MTRGTFSRSITAALGAICVFASPAYTEDDVTTRTLKGTGAAEGASVNINQVDTSAFPKVTIFASVLREGAPVLGLTAADFRVREDEVDQEPLTVVPKLTPLAVAVTFDTSGSMKKALDTAKVAALSFIDTLAADDEVLTMGFARQVTVLSPLNKNKSAAKSAVQGTVARGDTALFDALYASVDALKDTKGRKAIILLSDGVDDDGYGKQLSKRSVSEVIELAKRVNVPIFTIGLGASLDEATLTSVAKESGAAYYHAPDAGSLKALYDNIGKQLAGQYNIYYTSNLPGDGSTHRVQLSYDSFTSVKEYLSPNLASAAVVPVPTQAASEQVPPASKKVSLFNFAKLRAPNIEAENIAVYAKDTEKFAGHLTSKKRELELPAGDYVLKMTSVKMGPITLKGGETVEVKVGKIAVQGLLEGEDIGVRGTGTDAWAGTLNLRRNGGSLEVFPGTYILKIANCVSEAITVVEDQTSSFALGRIEVTNPIADVSFIANQKDGWCGTIKERTTSLAIFPGDYRLKINNCLSKPIQVSPGSTTKATLGFIRMNDVTGDFVIYPEDRDDWCGTISEANKVRQVFPGSYRMKVKQHFSAPFAVGEGETVEAN